MENAKYGKADGLSSEVRRSDGLMLHDAALTELRKDLDRVITDWNALVSQAASRSIIIANEAVHARPWVSVATAAALGAVLAIALTSKRGPAVADHIVPTAAPYAPVVQSRPWTVDTQPLISRLSQTWDSIAALNANALPTLPSMDVLTTFVKALLPSKAGV
jgi:ElaB/YqjD/DUF883 family membrane-anchored ribosome-binding protein